MNASPAPAERIAIVILSFNGTADTLACLHSLQPAACPDLDIIVVDNASADGAPAAIAAAFPHLTLIALAENRGWAGGNNAGIAEALRRGAACVCLLNNDTIVSPQAMRTLAQAARTHAPCLMHPAIDYADAADGPQLDPSRNIPPGEWQRLDPAGTLFRRHFTYGACLMVPSAVFARIGLLDERFFLQLEETDYGERAAKAGIPSLFTTEARIVHHESRSFGARQSPAKTYYAVRNTLLVIEKHGGAAPRLRQLYWSLARQSRLGGRTGLAASAIFWPLSRDPYVAAARAGVADYLRRRFGPRRPVPSAPA